MMTLSKRIALPWLALAAAVMACSGVGGLLGGTKNYDNAQVVVQDDFSDEGTGWEVGDYGAGSVGYDAGSYLVTSLGSGDTMWGAANLSYRNVVVDVDAAQISGPSNDNNDYGVICRLQENGDGYYLLVSGDGYYSILIGQGSSFDSLVEWTASDTVRQGNSTNHLRAICDGTTLTLFVNGEQVATIRNSTFSDGDIGLTATSYEDNESTAVRFDNLVVRQP